MGTGCALGFGSELTDLGSVMARSSGEDDASRRKHNADTTRADRHLNFIIARFLVRNCGTTLTKMLSDLQSCALVISLLPAPAFPKIAFAFAYRSIAPQSSHRGRTRTSSEFLGSEIAR